jgi:hypothetical protein
MRNWKLLLFATAVALAAPPTASRAAISYPAGTTLRDVWMSPPKIPADRAIQLLGDRLLSPHQAGSEGDLSDEDIEALKTLIVSRDQASEEPSDESGVQRFGGEISRESLSADQASVLDALALRMATTLGASAFGACVRQVPMILDIKYKVDFGWDVEVWGLAVFAVNLQYGLNNSDMVYGLFPFGFQIGYLDGLRCVLEHGIPSSNEELRACGREKQWQLQGVSSLQPSLMLVHEVPAVAQSSLPYAGALLTGQAGQFKSDHQIHPSGDSSWLLGAANTPLPSRVWTFLYNGAPGITYAYDVSMVVSWFPDLILFSGYNNVFRTSGGTLLYRGKGERNPHSLGDFTVHRSFYLFHSAVPACN